MYRCVQQASAPKVSIVMTAYNEPLWMVSEAIESILAQTFKDFEFIIILDNPSNFELQSLIKSYVSLDARVRLLTNVSNIGLAASLNYGLSIASGEFFSRMDADDISLPQRIEKQYLLINDIDCDLICSSVIRLHEDGSEHYPKQFSNPGKAWWSVTYSLPIMNTITHPTVMMKTAVLRKLGGYRNIIGGEDYDLWLRMLSLNCEMIKMAEPLLKYRKRSGSLTSNPLIPMTAQIYCTRLYRKSKMGVDAYSYKQMRNFYRLRCCFVSSIGKRIIEYSTADRSNLTKPQRFFSLISFMTKHPLSFFLFVHNQFYWKRHSYRWRKANRDE